MIENLNLDHDRWWFLAAAIVSLVGFCMLRKKILSILIPMEVVVYLMSFVFPNWTQSADKLHKKIVDAQRDTPERTRKSTRILSHFWKPTHPQSIEVYLRLMRPLPAACGLGELLEILGAEGCSYWDTARSTEQACWYPRIVSSVKKDKRYIHGPHADLLRLIANEDVLLASGWNMPKLVFVTTTAELDKFFDALLGFSSFVFVRTERDYGKIGGPPRWITFLIGGIMYSLEMARVGLTFLGRSSCIRLTKGIFVFWTAECVDCLFRFWGLAFPCCLVLSTYRPEITTLAGSEIVAYEFYVSPVSCKKIASQLINSGLRLTTEVRAIFVAAVQNAVLKTWLREIRADQALELIEKSLIINRRDLERVPINDTLIDEFEGAILNKELFQSLCLCRYLNAAMMGVLEEDYYSNEFIDKVVLGAEISCELVAAYSSLSWSRQGLKGVVESLQKVSIQGVKEPCSTCGSPNHVRHFCWSVNLLGALQFRQSGFMDCFLEAWRKTLRGPAALKHIEDRLEPAGLLGMKYEGCSATMPRTKYLFTLYGSFKTLPPRIIVTSWLHRIAPVREIHVFTKPNSSLIKRRRLPCQINNYMPTVQGTFIICCSIHDPLVPGHWVLRSGATLVITRDAPSA